MLHTTISYSRSDIVVVEVCSFFFPAAVVREDECPNICQYLKKKKKRILPFSLYKGHISSPLSFVLFLFFFLIRRNYFFLGVLDSFCVFFSPFFAAKCR